MALKKPLIIAKLLIIAAFLLLSPAISHAVQPEFKLSSQDLQYAKTANLWAEKGDWGNAMSYAGRASDPVVKKLFLWRKFLSSAEFTNISEVINFIENNPNWPDQDLLKKRVEEKITGNVAAKDILQWFGKPEGNDGKLRFRSPASHNGRVSLLRAIEEIKSSINIDEKEYERIVRLTWIEGDFSIKEERDFLARYGTKLRKNDFIKRIDNLIWDGNYAAAQRIMDVVDDDYQNLFLARIKLRNNKFGIDAAIKSVPEELINNEGLIYDRVLWKLKKRDEGGLIEMLLKVPHEPTHPEKWWRIKEIVIDDLVKSKKYKLAYVLAQNHNMDKDASAFADAEWLSGWLAFEFIGDSKAAYKHFYSLYSKVKTPISLGRAAYWSGRAAENNGNKDIAEKWYLVASKYPTSFYGQLATQKLGKKLLSIPEQPVPTWEDTKNFYENDLIKAVYIMNYLGNHGTAKKILKHAAKYAVSDGEKLLIAQFGLGLNRADYSITTAKELTKNGGLVVLNAHYPVIKSFTDYFGRTIREPEKALVHAIILQESLFDQQAKSPAGALGLMQLMPATANDMARNMHIPYNKVRLTSDSRYNITLGSRYLQKRIENYDGSYVLAIASYNAGGGNVIKWIRSNGDPRNMKTVEQVVDWIEKIPFDETRNYVQRVIENTQIYRFVLKTNSSPVVETAQDLRR